jgi:hypothetical protein
MTSSQKSTLLSIVRRPGAYVSPGLRDVLTGPNGSGQCESTGFVCAHRSCHSLIRLGLATAADCGGGAFRVYPTPLGREAAYTLIRREDTVIREAMRSAWAEAVGLWLDGITLPPGRGRSLAEILREAQQ